MSLPNLVRKKLLSFHCECALQRNGIDVPLNKNSKARLKSFHLYAFYENENLSSLQSPYIQISELNSEESVLYKVTISLIRKVLRPYIQEGKITIELMDENNIAYHQTRIVNCSDMSLTNSLKIESSIFMFISQSNKEMLVHLLSLLSDLHSKLKASKTEKNEIQSKINSKHTHIEKKQLNNSVEEVKRNENEGRRKINKSILNQKPQIQTGQINHVDLTNKRPFSTIKQEKNDNLNFKIKAGINKEKIGGFIKTIGFFNNIPEAVLEKIIEYLPKYENKNIILINKDFYNLIWRNMKNLNLKMKSEIPPNILKKFLSQIQTTQKISFGRLKNINPSFLLEALNFNQSNQIKEIDLTNYCKTNDKILIKLLQNCKCLEKLKLPYLSNLSRDSLLTINSYSKTLAYIEIKYDGPTTIQHNANITDFSLMNLIEKNQNLYGFNLAYVSNVFYEGFFKDGLIDLYSRLRIVKITNLVVSGAKNLDNLKYLMKYTNLQYLKLISVLQKNQYNIYENLNFDSNILEKITKSCSKINKIKFGGWCNNEMIFIIMENLKQLKEISFKNNQEIDDISMEILLHTQVNLEKIDISQCSKINGQCLEALNSKNLKKLMVCFDEHKINCTKNILEQKGLSMQVQIINKVMKKK